MSSISLPTASNLGSTPIRKSLQGSRHFASDHLTAEEFQIEMARGLEGQWVGPIPVQDFLAHFLPVPARALKQGKPNLADNYFDSLSVYEQEAQMYDPFIALVASAGLMPGFKLINSSSTADPESEDGMKIKPDISVYPESVDIDRNRTQFDKIETILELKPKRKPCDPFDDPDSDLTVAQRQAFRFEADSEERQKCRGQLGCYARVWFSRQHRLHGFMVWIGDPYARLIRFDRSGGIVSRRFNFRTEGKWLADFFWRFSKLSDEARGIDPTVSRASEEEAILAKSKLSNWAPKKERNILKLKVPHGSSYSNFLVWGAHADPQSATGRATRGYPAWDVALGKVVFLKDSWRSVEPGMEKESATLKTLNDNGVCNVPKLLCGDDLAGYTQKTFTKHYAAALWNVGGKAENIIERTHNRFAEDFVGVHLEHYKSSKQFLQAVHDAFIAHKDAYEKCGILHRDISGGNVLLTLDGGGILNDWDLAKTVTAIEEGPRQHFRSGTWQFMSADLLRNTQKSHALQDDIESFFYVVLYFVLRYMNHNRINILPYIMETIFEEYYPVAGHEAVGGANKKVLLTSRDPLEQGDSEFLVHDNEPITSLISRFLDVFEQWQQHLNYLKSKIRKMATEAKITREAAAQSLGFDTSELDLHNHDKIDSILREALEKETWPEGDIALDFLGPHFCASQKRKVERAQTTEEGSSKLPKTSHDSFQSSRAGPSDAYKDTQGSSSRFRPPYLRSSARLRDGASGKTSGEKDTLHR